MTSTNSQIFNAIATNSENIPEANMFSIYANTETAAEGLFLIPSDGISGRTDITGFLATSSNELGKMQWSNPDGFLSLNELSDVNAPNPSINQVLTWTGTYWEPLSLTDGGITSLNGLTATIQSFAIGTSGSDFNISSVGSVHTYNLPDSSATTRGALTSADWTTFNNKLSTSLTDSYIFVGDGTNVATGVSMSGEGTISNTGAFTLASVISGNKTFTGTIKTDLGLIIEDPGAGTNTITLQAPTLSGDYTLTLPDTQSLATGILENDGAGTLSWKRNNFAAGADPTTGNDTTQGYSVGSQWINTIDDFSFTCVNNSTGAAIWNFQSTYRLIAALQGVITGYNPTTTATSIPLNSVVSGTASANYSGGLALVDYDPFSIRSGNVYTLPTTGWYQLNCFISHPPDKILGAGSQDIIGSMTLRLNINNATGSSYMATAGDAVSGIGEGVTSLMTRYFNSGTTINYLWDFTTAATNDDFILSIGIYKL